MASSENRLSIPDYVVFVLVLAISAAIGLYFGYKQRRSSTSEILLGGRSMSIFPVVLSLTASFMSAITLLGTPAEIYTFTTIYLWMVFGFIVGIPIAAHLYVPMFYKLRLTSIFEILYTGIVLYAPSLAIQAVTGLNVWFCVLSVGLVSTLYTTLGGMKAVLWTDAFQMIIMLIGLIAVLVQGSVDNNGFGKIWNNMKDSGRVEFWNFDPDPTIRHTVWSLVIGDIFVWLPVFATNQAQVQRALSLPSLKRAKMAYWISVPIMVGMVMICGCCGMVVYSFYKDCDPLSTRRITARDQLLPLYVMDRLAYLKGIPGLFIASLFSGTLSTISSSLNSMAAVTLEDLIRPYCCPKITESRAAMVTKILAFVYGLVCIAMTFVASQLGGVLQAAMSLFGMIGGPQLAIFTLGILFPCANHIGAFIGFFSGLIIILWIGLGAFAFRKVRSVHPSPVSIAGCPVENATWWNVTTPWTTVSTEYDTGLQWTTAVEDVQPLPDTSGYVAVYGISYLWYGALSVFIVIIVGLVASIIVDCIMKPEKKKVDPRLTYPLLSNLMPCLPGNVKRFLSCYVDYDKKEPDAEMSQNGHVNKAYEAEKNNFYEANKPDEEKRKYVHPQSEQTNV